MSTSKNCIKQAEQSILLHQPTQQEHHSKTLEEQQEAKAMRHDQAAKHQNISTMRKTGCLLKYTSLEKRGGEMGLCTKDVETARYDG